MAKVTFGSETRLILPYLATDVVENFRWVTDVFTPRSGPAHEKRFSLRAQPRLEIAHSLHINRKNLLDVQTSLQQSAISNLWLIPVWQEARFIGPVSVDTDSGSISFATNGGRFGPLDKVLLVNLVTGNWYVIDFEVASFDDDILTLTFTDDTDIEPTHPGSIVMASAVIVPLHEGFLNQSNSLQLSTNVADGQVSLSFTATTSGTIATAAEPDLTIGGYDFYPDPLEAGSGLNYTVSTRQDITDSELGQIDRSEPWEIGISGFELKLLELTEFAGQHAIRSFLQRRLGQYRPFYSPRYDLLLYPVGTEDTQITTSIVVECPRAQALDLSSASLFILLKSGAYYIVDCDVETSSSTMTLNFLEATLDLTVEDVVGLYFISLVRLSSDTVEMRYSTKVTECSARCVIINEFVSGLEFTEGDFIVIDDDDSAIVSDDEETDESVMVY